MRALVDSTAGDRTGLETLEGLDEPVDVLVVGGGPAGSLTASGLARLGLRVVICEQAPPRRSKCCGQCLNPRVESLLERFGVLDAVESLAVGRTRRFEWRVGDAAVRAGRRRPPRPRTVNLDGAPAGWIVRREALDECLWKTAVGRGAVPVRGLAARVGPRRHGVREVRLGGDGRRLLARLVVGADGLGSGVARATGAAEGARAGRKFGFSGSLESSAERIAALELAGDCIQMRSTDGGYLGLVRESDGTIHVAGLVGPAAASRRPSEFVADLLGLPEPATLERRTACGPLPWSPREITRPGVALVGDAAGYVEPFTGEGMAWAIEGAASLVDAIARHGLGEVGLADYERRHRLAIGRRQRTCRGLACMLERPRLIAMAWRIAERLQVADTAADSIGRRIAAGLVRA